jgi:hypothetical protein
LLEGHAVSRSSSALPAPDPVAVARLSDAFREGEVVEWAACADVAAARRPSARLVVLGVVWLIVTGSAFTGFAFTLLGHEYDGVPRGVRIVLLSLAGAPFLLVGALGVFGHVPLRVRAARRTAFALTDERVVATAPLFTLFGPPRLRGLAVARIGHVELEFDDSGSPSEFAVVEIHDLRGVEPALRVGPVHCAAELAARHAARSSGARRTV